MPLEQTLEKTILSASGWRGIFAADGNGESSAPEISGDHRVIIIAAARVFAEFLSGGGDEEPSPGKPLVLVGRDTRPTGRAIAELMIRGLTASNCAVHYAGITAAPEIMARARNFANPENRTGHERGKRAGFVYISASHNPRGYNGLKFGLTGGGVLSGPEAAVLAESLRELLLNPESAASLRALAEQDGTKEIEAILAAETDEKQKARQDYYDFALVTAGGENSSIIRAVRAGLAEKTLSIAADLNGSARCLSIDKDFIVNLGARYRAINTEPGVIVHRIVPEGESLEPCREYLETLHREDPAFVLGYVPDCDGDRGNLVIWDDILTKARTLEAQEVFALACVSELAHLVWTGELKFDDAGRPLQKAAVAVNDPTSLRIDAIAAAFGAETFRAEVGEANVVSLARELRERGYLVRVLGEGSAGGNITHPSAVRDPINTVMALIKLLAVRSSPRKSGAENSNTAGFFELFCARSGQREKYRDDFTLADVISALPSFISTGTYTEDALLQVKNADHALLKDRYQSIFLKSWEARKAELAERFGIYGWEAASYIGTKETRGISRFGEAGRGGLRIIFKNRAGTDHACIWMRGSATEPVFRIMADAPGPDPRFERELVAWQRRMVMEADKI
jgi:phosphoglucomutase